jgi:hypothetical protein
MATNSITLKFTMSRGEYAGALRQGMLRQKTMQLLIAIFVCMTAAPLTLRFLSASAGAPVALSIRDFIYPAIGVIGVAYIFGVMPFLLVAKMNPAVRDHEQVFRATGEGAESVTGAGEVKVPWNALLGYRESGRFFLLQLGERQIVTLPKRAFATPQEITDFRNLLKQRVKR